MKKKIIIVLCFLLLVSAMYTFDYVRSKLFQLEVVSISPNPVVADGQTPVAITVKLTDSSGQPVRGHSLYTLAKTGGMMKSPREVTAADGMAHFTYFPYKASAVNEIRDAVIAVSDESNSIFIEIGTSTQFDIALTRPVEEKTSNEFLEGVFGE